MKNMREDLHWAGEVHKVELVVQCDQDVNGLLISHCRALRSHLAGLKGVVLVEA